MTNEKEAPEWWRKFITLATGGTYSYVRTEYIPSIVAEAMRRGEVKAWGEAKNLVSEWTPRELTDGYDEDTECPYCRASDPDCGCEAAETLGDTLLGKIDAKLKSLT